ncbi:MAG: molecular chaperone TorD family protein [Candidatus Thiodiazotropha sp. (ex Monitilora ramsayi)]|nr:molecular chaperone TorD family protein [Candidatus Thiodiazotropha sp. (ex Monitilora ramsayi)]
MSEPTTAETLRSEPAIRSRLYLLLAVGFRYPSREIFAALKNGIYQAEIGECIECLPHISTLPAVTAESGLGPLPMLREMPFEEFESLYTASFEVGYPEPPCPLYEGIYRGGERTQYMLRVSSYYKHFGLVMSQGDGRREVPDHLSAELEFMHFLTFKENQANEEGTEELLQGYLRAQKDFLQQQLSQWLPGFVKRLQTGCRIPFYVALGHLIHDVILSELEHVKSIQAGIVVNTTVEHTETSAVSSSTPSR